MPTELPLLAGQLLKPLLNKYDNIHERTEHN